MIRTGGNNLKIIISNQSELPIYAQIREQIKEQILNGQIKEGEILPSIRSLAKDVGVSVITTTRAYNDLEKEGFIATMQGKGSVVLSSNNKILKDYESRRRNRNCRGIGKADWYDKRRDNCHC